MYERSDPDCWPEDSQVWWELILSRTGSILQGTCLTSDYCVVSRKKESASEKKKKNEEKGSLLQDQRVHKDVGIQESQCCPIRWLHGKI